jgi:hypothetical protein
VHSSGYILNLEREVKLCAKKYILCCRMAVPDPLSPRKYGQRNRTLQLYVLSHLLLVIGSSTYRILGRALRAHVFSGSLTRKTH